ncbi:hypothetical protein PISMIDRAFT_680716 [Pisolithus microcarpus 441]|uniref:Uncharacterized protein n=1 Tax=Pisolithus microcarpus 441 TaxID=765257 RepID=A0A0C9YB72_9AGAM|nr:hypothetical protein PISMIDRAFT_680716 [Pisolithus microcarpus 441]
MDSGTRFLCTCCGLAVAKASRYTLFSTSVPVHVSDAANTRGAYLLGGFAADRLNATHN